MSDLLELEKKSDVWVGNEWGELKEVVIGRPDQLQFPTFNDMGGDVFQMGDRNVLLGFNDVDSNIWGLRWIADLLRKEGWKVHSVRYRDDCMHLDTAMSCPAEGVALACKEFFINGLPGLLEGWEIVDVDPEDARADACNGLPLGRGHYVMSTEWKKYGEKLRDHGIKPLYTPFEETNHVTGGGPRCAHGPLVREE